MLLNKKKLAKIKTKEFLFFYNQNKQTKDRLTVQRNVTDVRRRVTTI